MIRLHLSHYKHGFLLFIVLAFSLPLISFYYMEKYSFYIRYLKNFDSVALIHIRQTHPLGLLINVKIDHFLAFDRICLRKGDLLLVKKTGRNVYLSTTVK